MTPHVVQWCSATFSDLTTAQIITASIILLASFIARKVFVGTVMFFANRRSSDTKMSPEIQQGIISTISGPLSMVFIIIGIYTATEVLNLPGDFLSFMGRIAQTLVTFSVFWAMYLGIHHFSFVFDDIGKKFGREVTTEIRTIITLVFKILIFGVGIISILQAWGVNVTALLGGFGILTAAFALASQDTIANFYASVTVFLDKTFKKGDWIKTPDVEGTVEEIGVRTTTVRQFDKALVTVPNSKLAHAAVTNFSRMTQRRIKWSVGLRLDSTSEQLHNIVSNFKKYLEDNPEIETNPKKVTTLVFVDEITDFSIDIFLYFFTKTTKWAEYMRVKQDCVLAFMKIIEDEGADLAFPTQSIQMDMDRRPSQPKNQAMVAGVVELKPSEEVKVS